MSHGQEVFRAEKSGEDQSVEADFVTCPQCGLRKLKWPFRNVADGAGQMFRCSDCKSLFTVKKKTVLICELWDGPDSEVNLF